MAHGLGARARVERLENGAASERLSGAVPDTLGRERRDHVVIAPGIERVEEAGQQLRAVPFDCTSHLAAEIVGHQCGSALRRFTRPSAAPTRSPTSEPTAITCVPAC